MLDGPPAWCMVQSMVCQCCKRRVFAIDGEILCQIPAYIAASYPVDSKYALSNKNSHVGKSATDIFDQVMTTYGNGNLCSQLLYNSINRMYLEKVSSYYSCFKEKKRSAATTATTASVKPYIPKDGTYIKAFPPLGDTIRDLYDSACNNPNNAWGISDHDRNTREIQGVGCQFTMAQDHTFDVLRNYQQKKIGANALWDCATETGEIATAILVFNN